MNTNRLEKDPHGKSAHTPGSKLDSGKSPVRRGLLEQFPRACMAVAEVSAGGARKYTWGGWRTVPEGISRYGDAEVRHICKAAIEGPIDPDMGLLHAAHEAWGALARLELILIEREALETGKQTDQCGAQAPAATERATQGEDEQPLPGWHGGHLVQRYEGGLMDRVEVAAISTQARRDRAGPVPPAAPMGDGKAPGRA